PLIIASCLIVTRRSGGRGGQVGAGQRGKNGPAVGQQRTAVVEDHHAVAQKAPSLLWMAGHGPCTAAIMRQGTGAWGPMRALLFPRPRGGPKGLDGCHVVPLQTARPADPDARDESRRPAAGAGGGFRRACRPRGETRFLSAPDSSGDRDAPAPSSAGASQSGTACTHTSRAIPGAGRRVIC